MNIEKRTYTVIAKNKSYLFSFYVVKNVSLRKKVLVRAKKRS